MDSVSLKDFVAETLKAVSVGVADAQDFSRKNSAIPIALHSVGGKPTETGEQLVKFSISLQAESRGAVSGNAGIGGTIISVITGKLDVGVSSERSRQNVHNVEFAVPIHFNSRWPSEEEAK